jgi:hypothetical protein
VFDGQLEFSTHAGSTYSVAFWTVQPTLCMALFQHANVKDALQRVREIMLRESFRIGLPIAKNLAVAGMPTQSSQAPFQRSARAVILMGNSQLL